MRLILCILSFVGAIASAYFLYTGWEGSYDTNHLLYLLLLLIILCNCIIGVIMTLPELLKYRSRVRIISKQKPIF
jgi:hypothetical protein